MPIAAGTAPLMASDDDGAFRLRHALATSVVQRLQMEANHPASRKHRVDLPSLPVVVADGVLGSRCRDREAVVFLDIPETVVQPGVRDGDLASGRDYGGEIFELDYF